LTKLPANLFAERRSSSSEEILFAALKSSPPEREHFAFPRDGTAGTSVPKYRELCPIVPDCCDSQTSGPVLLPDFIGMIEFDRIHSVWEYCMGIIEKNENPRRNVLLHCRIHDIGESTIRKPVPTSLTLNGIPTATNFVHGLKLHSGCLFPGRT